MWNHVHFLRLIFGCTHHTCLGQVRDCSFYQGEEVLKIYSLTSLCIISILFSTHLPRCWQGEVLKQSRASLVGDHFLYFHNLNVWFRGDIVGRNLMLVIFGVKGLRLENTLFSLQSAQALAIGMFPPSTPLSGKSQVVDINVMDKEYDDIEPNPKWVMYKWFQNWLISCTTVYLSL